MKLRHSIRWRFLIVLIIVFIFAIGGLSTYFSTFIYNTFVDNLKTNLLEDANILSYQLSDIEQISSTELTQFVETNAQFTNKRVTIILPNGEVIGDSEYDVNEMDNHLYRPEVQKALSGSPSDIIRFSNTLQKEFLYIAVPIMNNGQLVGVLRLAASLDLIEQERKSIQTSIITALIITLVIAITLIFFTTSLTIKPLQTLTNNVNTMTIDKLKNLSPINRKDEIGELDRAFVNMTNELNQQIEELKNERVRLASVLRHMTDGIIIVDKDGVVQLINPAAISLFTITSEEPVGQSLAGVVRNHHVVSLWEDCRRTHKQCTATIETSPERRFINVIATPLHEDLPDRILLIFQELTRIRQLEMIRRDFVSNVSHELRTPLASLKALTDTLSEGALEDPPAAKNFLKMMDSEIDNLTQLVSELLELSRIESGRVPLERQATYPYEVLVPAVERMQLQAERSGITIFLECPNDLPQIYIDRSRIEQVLINIIHNAIKFTKQGGSITVSAIYKDPNIIVSVKDTGIGIPPESLKRIFERFYKEDRARASHGTGLGLSIARHSIESHGGSIWADSVPGKGSAFSFSLPVMFTSH